MAVPTKQMTSLLFLCPGIGCGRWVWLRGGVMVGCPVQGNRFIPMSNVEKTARSLAHCQTLGDSWPRL